MDFLVMLVRIGFLTLAVYIAINIAINYKRETGTTWQRLLAAAKDSATMLWGKVVLFIAGITANLDDIAGGLSLPEVKTWISTNLGDPKVLASVMAAIALVGMAARIRTLGK